MIIYKIRNTVTGNYLTGTPTYHSWDKDGRIFLTLGKLRTFLTIILKAKRAVSNWEIVELELTEQSVKGVHEIIKPEQLIKLLTK
jgi:hypothetical protein